LAMISVWLSLVSVIEVSFRVQDGSSVLIVYSPFA